VGPSDTRSIAALSRPQAQRNVILGNPHGAEPEPRRHEGGSVIAQESAVRWNEIAHDEL
jgi:hypothetical protein